MHEDTVSRWPFVSREVAKARRFGESGVCFASFAPLRETTAIGRAGTSVRRSFVQIEPVLQIGQRLETEQGFAQGLDLWKRQAADAIRNVIRQPSANLDKQPQQEADAASRFSSRFSPRFGNSFHGCHVWHIQGLLQFPKFLLEPLTQRLGQVHHPVDQPEENSPL
jgi:hypothetical protein